MEEDDEFDDVVEDFYIFLEWEEYIEESVEKVVKLLIDKEVFLVEISKIGILEVRVLKDSCNMKFESFEDEFFLVVVVVIVIKLFIFEEEIKDVVVEVL